jgi:hypothetical protein
MNVQDLLGRSIRKVIENATSGATSAASIATSTAGTGKGAIGVGFDPNGNKGIYQGKLKKQSSKGSNIIRR